MLSQSIVGDPIITQERSMIGESGTGAWRITNYAIQQPFREDYQASAVPDKILKCVILLSSSSMSLSPFVDSGVRAAYDL
jgi:hypothetical protein